MLRRFFLTVSILLVIMHPASSQSDSAGSLRLMFWNVENAFDIYNDTATADDDFLPGGVRRWTFTRYRKKINNIYKTIIAAGEWDPPEMIAFSEIENRSVLEDLLTDTWLSKYGYNIIHEDSPDDRGIDVCMIYRTDRIKVTAYCYWVPEGLTGSFTSRSVLCVKAVSEDDTFHIIVNHWPSRLGGELAGKEIRAEIASMVRQKADSISKARECSKVIITGDFNCTPDEMEIKILTSPGKDNIRFINLSGELARDKPGTYRFRGEWEMIDQVIVSDHLLSCSYGLFTGARMLKIFKPDFLLKEDQSYPGLSPFSTYRGFRYQGGFSDHLPVILTLGFHARPQ